MARPAVATPETVRSAVFALLAEAGMGSSPASAQSFRRVVSVRKVRERLGGGDPAAIGQAINVLQAEVVQPGAEAVVLPDLPSDIAELMQQLWRAAVGVQLDDVARLRNDARCLADAARDQLSEAQLRAEMLHHEVGELRAALGERDVRLAQAGTAQTQQTEQALVLQQQLDAARAAEAQRQAELDQLRRSHDEALAAARERYEGMSRRLLEETAQQRQAAQAEVARLTSQLKFADKREVAAQARLQQLDADLAEARALKDQAVGEVSALRYVNTSLRAQINEFMRSTRPAAPAPAVPGLARGRKRPAKAVR
jgi:hypothetical protein